MASQQSSRELIADRYASALYEYSTETKCVDQVLSDLLKIQDYIKHNNDFKLLIKSPLISSNEKMNRFTFMRIKNILYSKSKFILGFVKLRTLSMKLLALVASLSKESTLTLSFRDIAALW